MAIRRSVDAFTARAAQTQPSFKVASSSAVAILYQRVKLMASTQPPSVTATRPAPAHCRGAYWPALPAPRA
eukprot:2442607-Prymnesium_polylepis.1